MATMPGGAPYPLGTDHVVDGDDAIHALATYADRTHAELSGNATANNGVAVAVSGWALAAASSWGSVVTISGANLVVAAGGLYDVHVALRFGAAIAGRAYGEINVGGVLVSRSLGGGGDDNTSVSVPGVLLNTGDQVQVLAWQGSGAAQSVFATVRITRNGPGKPPAGTLLPAPELPDRIAILPAPEVEP